MTHPRDGDRVDSLHEFHTPVRTAVEQLVDQLDTVIGIVLYGSVARGTADRRIQLRKACRLLRDHDGFHTSVIEMSFVAIERTLEFYALTASNDTIDDFHEGHDRAYDRGAELGLVTEETARRLKQLYRDNRAVAYYRDTVAATQQADAMFNLAVVSHDYIKDFAQYSHECRCRR